MSEEKKISLPELTEEQRKMENPEFTDEQKQQYKEYIEDQMTRLGEVFSQCWESEEFKQAFIEDPKAIFDEYGVVYNENSNYKIIDTPDKTIIHVLPYKGVKNGMKQVCDILMNHVKDLEDDEEKQVLLEGWSWQIYQNTEDTYFVPLPICPENLSPEELELVNGGCLAVVIAFAFEFAGVATSAFTSAELALAAFTVVAAMADTVVIAAVGAVYGVMVMELVVALQTAYLQYTVSTRTGEIAFTFVHGSNDAVFPSFKGKKS